MTDHAIAVIEPHRAGGAMTLVRPIAKPTDLLALHDDVTAIVRENLQEGLDYGTIPGTNEVSLYQPGAEKLNLAFGASPELEIIEKEIDHDRSVRWSKRKKKYNNRTPGDKSFTTVTEDGVSLGLYRYVIRCRLVRDGRILGESMAACSTLESKYIHSPRDHENTVLKMAVKRAYVGATNKAYALSKRFLKGAAPAEMAAAQPGPPAQDWEPPAPKRPPYDGSPEHMQKLAKVLGDKKVPEEFWEEIGKRMLGKNLDALLGVIEAVRSEGAKG